jgi:hypothetical protein
MWNDAPAFVTNSTDYSLWGLLWERGRDRSWIFAYWLTLGSALFDILLYGITYNTFHYDWDYHSYRNANPDYTVIATDGVSNDKTKSSACIGGIDQYGNSC